MLFQSFKSEHCPKSSLARSTISTSFSWGSILVSFESEFESNAFDAKLQKNGRDGIYILQWYILLEQKGKCTGLKEMPELKSSRQQYVLTAIATDQDLVYCW